MATTAYILIAPAVLHAALGSGLVWLGDRVALLGMAFDLKTTGVDFYIVCLPMPLTRHLKILTSFSR